MRKLDYIDALRGLAILGVLVVHTSQYGNANLPSFIGRTLSEGARGVQLFFLASAFTLFLSFKNRFTKESFPIKNFFIRRFFRIAPMYYLGILYYTSKEIFGNETHITISSIISNIIFLHGFSPYWMNTLVPGGWSIGVEMTFYAILPLLFLRIRNINQAFNFLLFSLLINALISWILGKFQPIESESLWKDFIFLYFPSQLPIFGLGILMYFIVIEFEGPNRISGNSLLLFSGIILVQWATRIRYLLGNHIIFGFGFLILGIGLSRYKFKLIVNPLINYIGKISFSMYLVHFAVLYWLQFFGFIDYFRNAVLNYAARLSIVTLLTVLISSITYAFIEVPFQNLGKKIIDKAETSAAGA